MILRECTVSMSLLVIWLKFTTKSTQKREQRKWNLISMAMKKNATLLACGNAGGKMLRPLVIFNGIMHIDSRWENTEERCWIGVNLSGYMDCPLFTEYVKAELIPRMTVILVFHVHCRVIVAIRG